MMMKWKRSSILSVYKVLSKEKFNKEFQLIEEKDLLNLRNGDNLFSVSHLLTNNNFVLILTTKLTIDVIKKNDVSWIMVDSTFKTNNYGYALLLLQYY